MPHAATPRAARAALVAAAMTILTLAGHAAGGGALDPVGLVVVLLVSALLGSAVSRRPLPLPALAVLLVAGQGLLHLLMTFTASHAHAGPERPALLMLATHVGAAGVAALVIRYADELICRWIDFFDAAIRAWKLAAVPVILRPAPAAQPSAHALAPMTMLARGLTRRGPPLVATFAV